MQFKDIALLLAAAGSAVALPAPEQEAPVRRGEQAEQKEAGEQWVNPQLNALPGQFGRGGIQNLQLWQAGDPRFGGNNNGFDPRLLSLFSDNDDLFDNGLFKRAEQAEQGKQIFPGLNNNQFGNGFDPDGFGNNDNSITAGGFGGGGVSLTGGNNGFGNNNWNPNGNIPPWLLNQNRGFFPQQNRFPFGNQLLGGPGRFNNFGNNQGFPGFF